MELIDVLDSNGNFLGTTKTRKQVHKNGDWHRAIHVLIINENKEILIQKRSFNKEKHPNMWDISCAGHVSAGDSSKEAASREIEEELGIKVDQDQLLYIHTIKKTYYPKPYFIENEFQDVYLYRSNININNIILQKEEVSEAKYIPYEDFKKMIENENENMVNRKKEYKLIFDIIDEYLNKW